MDFLQIYLLLFIFCCQGSAALQWTTKTQAKALIQTCAGSNITLPWFFTLDPGEDLEDIKWLYTPGGTTPDLMANYIYGTFIAMPPFTGRVQHVGNGSIVLSRSTPQDSGDYTIEVTAHTGGSFQSLRHTLVVQVAEAPPEHGQDHLSVVEKEQAVYDNFTDQFHIQLECGHLSSRGQPSVDVVWTTPSGAERDSSFYDNGTFFLLLGNPVKGGNYTCRLSPLHSATHCLPADAPLLRETTVHVDAVAARLTIMEATGNALKEENSKLKKELNETRTTLTAENNRLKKELNETQTSLTQENQLLQEALLLTNHSLLDVDNRLRIELRLTEQRLQDIGQQVQTARTELSHANHTLTAHLQDLGVQLQHYRDESSRVVNFHAMTSALQELKGTGHVVFDVIHTNDGAAYDNTTGEFTVPWNGTYFFAFSTTPYGPDQYASAWLTVDGHQVVSVDTKYGDYFNMATGHAVLRLTKGQRVWVSSSTGDDCYADGLSFFTGFLVRSD